MGERPSTPQARRAVAKFIERYFLVLKRQLAEQTHAFWARIEQTAAARELDDKTNENKDAKKRGGD
jgi:hypothetical protein